jgi:oxygen-independent coproporphyrinogen-3 oxidase
VNRVQPYDVVAAAADQLRAAGIDRFSADLLYGLPKQTAETVARAVEMTAELGPDRVSLFGYAHVPWMRPHQKLIHEADLPGPEDRLNMFRTAERALAANGFVAVGLDHFARREDALAVAARTGTLHRNFQGYTTDTADALIGFGASAIGTLPQGYAQNAPTVPGYRKAIAAGELATVRGVALKDDDRLRRAVIERLMCDFRVDLDELGGLFGADREDFADALLALAPLADDGLVEVNAGRIEVLPEARIAVRSVCAAFDRYLDQGTARHSQAI